jgi:hypothetical protein
MKIIVVLDRKEKTTGDRRRRKDDDSSLIFNKICNTWQYCTYLIAAVPLQVE